MDFSLTEEQEMLKKMARDFLETESPKTLVKEMVRDERGYPPELWKKMADLGWTGLILPEEYGGTGNSFLDLVVLLEETGRGCLPGPFFSTAVGTIALLEAASKAQQQELLPQIAEGSLIVTIAVTEPSARYDAEAIKVTATQSGDEYVIEGTKLFISDAHVADWLIVVTRTSEDADPTNGITLLLVDAKSPGINVTPLVTIAGDKQCEVIFDKVKVPAKNILGEKDKGWPIVDRVLQKATIGLCAQMVGGAQQVLEMSVDYAKERVQFGRPIGSFQAIQHHCANMSIDVDGCRFITFQAAWRLTEGMSATKEVAMAKAWCSDAFRRVTVLGHQIFGGIGFIEDHDMPLYFKRAKAWEVLFGDTTVQQEIIAQELGL